MQRVKRNLRNRTDAANRQSAYLTMQSECNVSNKAVLDNIVKFDNYIVPVRM